MTLGLTCTVPCAAVSPALADEAVQVRSVWKLLLLLRKAPASPVEPHKFSANRFQAKPE